MRPTLSAAKVTQIVTFDDGLYAMQVVDTGYSEPVQERILETAETYLEHAPVLVDEVNKEIEDRGYALVVSSRSDVIIVPMGVPSGADSL